MSSIVWKQYFTAGGGAGVELYEIDYNDKAHADCVSSYLQTHKDVVEQIYLGDQSDKSFLQTVVANSTGNYDIVIDDGGHKYIHQKPSFEVLWDHVMPGGLYFIEDLDIQSSRSGMNRDILGWIDMLASTRYPSHPSWTGNDPIKWVSWPWSDLPKNMIAVHVQAQIAVFRKAYPPSVKTNTTTSSAADPSAGTDSSSPSPSSSLVQWRRRNYWQAHKCALEGSSPYR